MKKKSMLLLSLVMAFCLTLTFGLGACGNNASQQQPAEEPAAEEEAAVETFDGPSVGYTGDQWSEYAIYQYLTEQVAPNYEMPEGAFTVPVVRIIDSETDSDDGDMDVLGDFWVFNYVVEGDTLKCVSGGDHCGKMELIQVGEGYSVKEFEQVGDGANFEPTARDIFEEHYDKFMEVQSDQDGREKARAEGLAAYVKAKGLNVTKYQDEGWDPVDIPL